MLWKRTALCVLVMLRPAGVMGAEERVVDEAGYAEKIAPFFQEHCLRCHGPDKQKGELRVDTGLPRDFLDPAAKSKWGELVDALNSHGMPPEEEPQPDPAHTAAVVDWVTAQMVRAEEIRRDTAVVLRRLNRAEYENTIRDLTGVDFDASGFPADPAAGGFDNNGRALTMSPLHMELYLDAARRVLDRALVTGDRPAVVKWRFEPEEGGGDDHRIRLPDGQNPIVHGGQNEKRGPVTVMRRASWDRNPNVRDFAMPAEGEYVIRIRAGGRVPGRAEVVRSAEKFLAKRRDKERKEKPANKWADEAYERDLAHFKTDRMYDYGRPRLKLIQELAGQPRVLAEFDVDAAADAPKVFEFRTRFTTQKAGLTLEYAYNIPGVLENFWMRGDDSFAAPEARVDWMEIEGPLYDAWPPSTHTRVLPESPRRESDPRGYVRETLAAFMRKAWRRPVSDAEVDAKLALYDRATEEKADFLDAVKAPFTAVLASPHFLYLSEPVAPGSRELDAHAVAARLAYFLWSGPSDAELSALADSGALVKPEVLTAQADRLLRDERSEALVTNFAGQWLGLRAVGSNPPATDLFPAYDRHLEESFTGESLAFFREILRRDLSAENFVRSDFVVINERLARHYGIDGVRGEFFRSVPVPAGVRRGGVATQGSVLTITSNGTRTSPVKRGVWVMKTLLGMDPGLPVANAGDIAPKVPGLDKATVRQRLQIHRELPQCARCHDRIDPLGFALEHFNAAGEQREREGFGYKGRVEENDPLIDASSRMPDGTICDGVEGLQNELLKHGDLFFNALAGRMYSYALGREAGLADQPAIRAAAAHMKANGGTLRSLILHLVSSPAFRQK